MTSIASDSTSMDEIEPVVEGPNPPSTPKKNGPSIKKDGTPRKPRRAPSASPTKTSVKEAIIGTPPHNGEPNKPSDVNVVVALFERVVAKGTPEDVAAIAEQFGVDKRLLRLSWNNTFKKKGIKLIREGWS